MESEQDIISQQQQEMNDSGDAVEHELSGDLTLVNIAEVKTKIASALAAADSVTFRFGEVGSVDLSFVQLLCSAYRTAHDQEKSLSFSGEWPTAFSELAEASGLTGHVGCSTDCSLACLWLNKF